MLHQINTGIIDWEYYYYPQRTRLFWYGAHTAVNEAVIRWQTDRQTEGLERFLPTCLHKGGTKLSYSLFNKGPAVDEEPPTQPPTTHPNALFTFNPQSGAPIWIALGHKPQIGSRAGAWDGKIDWLERDLQADDERRRLQYIHSKDVVC